MYEAVAQDSSGGEVPSPETHPDLYQDDPDDIYEECGEDQDVFPPAPAKASKPPALPQPEEVDEIYDACQSELSTGEKEAVTSAEEPPLPPPPLPAVPTPKRRDPPPVPMSADQLPLPPPPKMDLPAIPKSIPPPVPDRRPSNAESGGPPLPSNPPPLPGRGGIARIPQLRKPFMDREEDFENVCYGRWSCSGDSNKELTFQQGDMIHVLSRDFDAESWWVGELDGRVGLVPKDYLCPAFELVVP